MDRAIWHFCRGLAFAARGNPAAAEAEKSELDALAQSGEAKELNEPTFPATDTLTIASHWLAGKVAGARGDSRSMISQLEAAAKAMDEMPYMEPAYWPFPVRPTLGAAFLRSGDPKEAERVFREDLKQWPRNAWGLFGLEQTLRQQGRPQNAESVHREFLETWKYADVKLELDHF